MITVSSFFLILKRLQHLPFIRFLEDDDTEKLMQENRPQRSVLFVCTANICRSPMAVGLFQLINTSETALWRVESAGVYAKTGCPAAEYTLRVLEDRGIDLSDHRSRAISSELMTDFQLILTMEKNHKEALQAAFPEHSHKTMVFTAIVGENRDIIDPIGRSYLEYEHTARELESILQLGFPYICRMTGEIKND